MDNKNPLGMIPYEDLYGIRCRTPVTWDNPVNRIVLGPELLKEMEQEVVKIRQNLKAAHDRQKSYADKHRVNREFSVGYHVYLRVRARKSSLKLGSCVKLSSRYCGPFEVLERIGTVAYRLHCLLALELIMFFMFLCLRDMYMILTM